ncbi:MAG: hypothetical protein ABJN69_05835 [Hellea sp.]
MRLFILALGLVLASCATAPKDKPAPAPEADGSFGLLTSGLAEKTLAPGECGLYVWTADAAKTFTLFAKESQITYLSGGKEVLLTEKNPTVPPARSREFRDENGKSLSLTLLSPQQIEEGTRYKSGRLISLDADGWEKIVPIVGFYACQPDI